jgi:hypothetical protein
VNILKVRTRAGDQPDLPPPAFFLFLHDFSTRKREDDPKELRLDLGPQAPQPESETQPEA